MNIFMLLYLKYPDIRVEKEVNSLLKKGYSITIMAANDGNQAEITTEGNLTIYRPHEWSYSYIWTGFHYFWGSINFVNKWVLKKCREYISDKHFDVIHVHDLRLVKVGVLLAKQFDMKVIADLHENYPAAIKSYVMDNSIKSIIRRYSVDRYSRWVAYEKQILQEVDAVIAVVDEAKTRIVRDCKISPEKVYVVSNTESMNYFGKMSIDTAIANNYKGKFVISYIGGVDFHRGLDTVIKAMPQILKKKTNAILLIVGGKDDHCERSLKALAKSCGVEENVRFLGRIPFSQVPSYIAASDMGIIPQYASEHGNYTVPHKLFQYMVLGKPVIVSDCYPLKRIVSEYDCGLVFNSNDSGSLGECFAKPVDSDRLGINALKAVREKYNWEEDEQRLFALYSSLMN